MAMDETELRIAALETALIELAAWPPADTVEGAMRSISAGLDAAGDGDERTIRCGAVAILHDGRQRFDGGAPA